MAQVPVGPGQVYAAYAAMGCSPDPAGQYIAQQFQAIGQAIDASGLHAIPADVAVSDQPVSEG